MSANTPVEPWKLVSSTYSYRDRWLSLRSDTVRLPSGRTLTPYHVVELPDWVNIVAIDRLGNILLVEQYRHAIRRTLMELPAGQIDAGESREQAARRELLEETGHAGDSWFELGSLPPVASRLNNQVHAFLALNVGKVAEPVMEESETIRLHAVPWPGFAESVRTSKSWPMEAAQMATLFLLHLFACASGDPEIHRLKF